MKSFIAKLLLFAIFILILQTIIANYFPYKMPESVQKINKAKKEKTDIIYFGDSTTTWYSKNDSDTRSMPLILYNDLQDKYSTADISHVSYSSFLYDDLTRYMVEQNYFPSFIIIPINLKSFSPDWDLRAPHQFVDERLYITFHDTLLAPFLTFVLNMGVTDVNRIYDNLRDLALIYDGDKIVGTGKEYQDKLKNSTLTNDQTAAMLQLYYLGKVHANHRNIQALINIAERYKDTKTKVIFYITPIDYESGKKYFGNRFYDQLKENTATITSELKKHNATIVDLSDTQPAKNFTWREVNYVNEHLNQEGRVAIIKTLTPLIDQTLVEKK